jgi:hypothetical protein
MRLDSTFFIFSGVDEVGVSVQLIQKNQQRIEVQYTIKRQEVIEEK